MNAPRFNLAVSALAFTAVLVLWGQTVLYAPPPGRGGGKNEDPVVTMTFRDDAIDRVYSDGIYSDGGPYVGGTEGANIRFHSSGTFLFNVTAPRRLWMDFSVEAEPPACGESCNKDFTITNTGDGTAGAVWVPGGFLDMEVGESQLGEMKIGWGPRDLRWSVRFQQTTGDAGIDESILNKSTFVEVRHPEENSWVVEAIEPSTQLGAGDRGLLWSRTGRRNRATYHDEGTYHLPFLLTVTR